MIALFKRCMFTKMVLFFYLWKDDVFKKKYLC